MGMLLIGTTWHVVTALSGIAVINLDFSFQWLIPLHGHASDWYLSLIHISEPTRPP